MNNDVIYLKFPENVRKNPGTYIGGDTSTSDVLVREIIDNSIDEFYNNTSSDYLSIYHDDNKILISDNGRGIPLKNSTVEDSEGILYTQARLAVEKLHAGSKFNNINTITTGTHGLGSAIVSALSERFILFVNMNRYKSKDYSDKIKLLMSNSKIKLTDDLYYMVEYSYGVLKNECLIKLSNDYIKKELSLNTKLNVKNISTLVYFIPDSTIIQSKKVTIPDLKYRTYITELLYKKKLNIYINDIEQINSFNPYKFQFKSIIDGHTFLVSFELTDKLEKEKFTGSVNGLIVNYGSHKEWTLRAYKDAFRDYFGSLNSYEGYGLIINTIVLSSEPSYTSQIKTEVKHIGKINYTQAKQLIDHFKLIFKKNQELFKEHYNQLITFTSKITNISKKEIVKSKINLNSQTTKFIPPQNLIDCYTQDRDSAELYLVEGQSAAGSLAQAREPDIHAILPLKGKPLNCVDMDIVDVLENKEMNDIITSLGTGVDSYNDTSKLRYGKIILGCDSDSDGFHIQLLLVGFFLSHMKYLIEQGFVYIAKNPLYTQDGKYYFDNEFDKINKKRPFIRFKGLGQANPEQLFDFMLNKDNRFLYRVTLGDLENSLKLISSPEMKRDLMIEEKFFTFKNKINMDKFNEH